ncbi:trypsin-like serine peptidase [Allostreptomyces psammosilenae]|uniref:V8-like Glu-specific endopeptidase n=1 Tax=Allostreptomyces psammosilenae TaxID=1892865 RepID=A0A852ZL09_9ACTN|nr:hypothetical protein [Allostreptomyces psammosilenae]NYI03093.1 hypothetical protein [Allostreptomyces psammosilenae]
MSRRFLTRGRRGGAALAALTASLLLATACAPSGEDPAAAPSASPSAEPSGDAPGPGSEALAIPEFDVDLDQLAEQGIEALENLEGYEDWQWDDWRNWADQHIFQNPLIRDLWDPERFEQAEPPQQEEPPAESPTPEPEEPDDGVPPAIEAEAAPRPYAETGEAIVGKLFFDTPEGPAECSATVVADPSNPGASNLVWTAGHCVHGGNGAGWYRNIMFVPAFNSAGNAEDPDVTTEELSPYGAWWAVDATASTLWQESGENYGNEASTEDWAILRVANMDGSTTSLEETVGDAAPVWFNADEELARADAWGYPAVPPYDGLDLYSCAQDDPDRLDVTPDTTPMWWIGCTMTGGASGGGWFAERDGERVLISNNSIADLDYTWMAGPYLGAEAEAAFEEFTAG